MSPVSQPPEITQHGKKSPPGGPSAANGASGERTFSPPAWSGLLIGGLFFVVGTWFLCGPSGIASHESGHVPIDPEALSTAPRRTALGDPPTVTFDGTEYTCMGYHRNIAQRATEPKELFQHRHVSLDHGINHSCHNCHHTEDRDKLVLYDGTTVPFTRVVELCAKCHGPTYRDWERGAHGRTNGYWDPTRGEVRRLTCTACHDPHRPRTPAMDPLKPLPGPSTRRLSPQKQSSDGPSLGHRKEAAP